MPGLSPGIRSVGRGLACGSRYYLGAKQLRQETVLKAIEQLLLAGVIGVISLGVTQLKSISTELNELKTSLAVIVVQVHDHDRRLEAIEHRRGK